MLDVRATFELEDGALVYTTYGGVAELGPDGYQRFLAGNPPDRVQLPLRLATILATPIICGSTACNVSV